MTDTFKEIAQFSVKKVISVFQDKFRFLEIMMCVKKCRIQSVSFVEVIASHWSYSINWYFFRL